MSAAAVRPYFRARLNALGYKEWTDGFNSENIPSTLLDRSYFLGPPSFDGEPINQADLEITVLMSVAVFYKGYRSPAQAIDTATTDLDSILTECLAAANRLGTAVKNVRVSRAEIAPLAASNDNAIILRIDFEALTILNVES